MQISGMIYISILRNSRADAAGSRTLGEPPSSNCNAPSPDVDLTWGVFSSSLGETLSAGEIVRAVILTVVAMISTKWEFTEETYVCLKYLVTAGDLATNIDGLARHHPPSCHNKS